MGIKLSSGKEVEINLYKLSTREFREIVELDGNEISTSRSDELLGKTVGLKPKEIEELPYPDFRLLSVSFWSKVRELSTELKEGAGSPN